MMVFNELKTAGLRLVAARGRRRVLVDVLGLAVLVEAGRSQFAPDPGLLEAAERRVGRLRGPVHRVRAGADPPGGACRRLPDAWLF